MRWVQSLAETLQDQVVSVDGKAARLSRDVVRGVLPLRMMRLQMKISGCFRTTEGARRFADLRSLIETDRKQGRNLLVALSPDRHPVTPCTST